MSSGARPGCFGAYFLLFPQWRVINPHSILFCRCLSRFLLLQCSVLNTGIKSYPGSENRLEKLIGSLFAAPVILVFFPTVHSVDKDNRHSSSVETVYPNDVCTSR